jgi:recombinational DNA repair protein RecR
MYSTRDNTFDLNTQTEKAAYEVLSRYLEEVHGIKKSRAALKSIISRLKNEDKKNSG